MCRKIAKGDRNIECVIKFANGQSSPDDKYTSLSINFDHVLKSLVSSIFSVAGLLSCLLASIGADVSYGFFICSNETEQQHKSTQPCFLILLKQP